MPPELYRPAPNRAIVDAGLKAPAIDSGTPLAVVTGRGPGF